MSLLLKALQNAARNREAAGASHAETGAGGEAPPPGELTLEPVQPTSRASTRAQPPLDEEPSGRYAAPGPQQAQTVLRAGARPARPAKSGPGILDWLARRPLVAFSTAAGLFAIGYGIYLYLQITNPSLFIAQPSAPPPPPPPPQIAAAPRPAEPPAARTLPTPPPPSVAPPASSPTGAAPVPSPAAPVTPPVGGSPTTRPDATAPQTPGSVSPVPSPAPTARTAPSTAGERVEVAASTARSGTPSIPPAPRSVPPSAGMAPAGPPASGRPPASAPAVSGTIAMAPSGAEAAPSGVGRSGVASRPASKKPAAGASEAPEGIAPAAGAQMVAVDSNVLNAYQALEQGRLDDAERGYRQALSSDPRNMDAMLGLAATLSQQNKGDAAGQLYMRVLEQDPRNSYAQAGLLNIGGRADPVAAEARLKQLIAREPSAFLYFTLGNLYSEQSQWAAAQSAYFQAHTLAPDNPDYAFNLAVGLEHLSQPKLALDYYRRALALAQTRGHAQFDSARVENRIRSLEQTLAQIP